MHTALFRSRIQLLVLVAATILLGTSPLLAQQKRISPIDVTGTVIDGNRVTIYYSRPYTKDPKTGAPRKIWGGLVPFGQVWRTGANEATLLVTQQPIDLGGVTVPAGAVTLFTLPAADGSAKLVISKQVGQWGTQYDEKQDLARVDLTKTNLDKAVDQFTMSVEKNPNGNGGLIKMMWENTQYSIPFTVHK
ncbi:MAG: DUF2911 domain-containing protein [Abitibacteriaceae bacterium]|nr:DUF2911 domain-containing protein [Abditibacteriaceae bacterium]MBV9864135.1 DUF2911 domain-containing protein [Abditibacteriaceae bacterium]